MQPEKIVRTPSVVSRAGPVRPGSPWWMTVDLAYNGEQDEEGWNEHPIRVWVSSDYLAFKPDEGVILLRRNRASLPCTLVATLEGLPAEPPTETEVILTFFTSNGRYAGTTRKKFPVAT